MLGVLGSPDLMVTPLGGYYRKAAEHLQVLLKSMEELPDLPETK